MLFSALLFEFVPLLPGFGLAISEIEFTVQCTWDTWVAASGGASETRHEFKLCFGNLLLFDRKFVVKFDLKPRFGMQRGSSSFVPETIVGNFFNHSNPAFSRGIARAESGSDYFGF